MKILFTSVLLAVMGLTSFAQTSITFLHFNDLHAHLVPHKDLVRSGDPCGIDPGASQQIGYRGGLARLKTLIDSLEAAHPNHVLMNIGDTYHGGVEAAYTTGNAIVDPVNAMGFDIGVPGNWDFAYGPGVFRKRYTPTGPFPNMLNPTLPSYPIKSPNFPYLAANLTYDKLSPIDPSTDGDQVLPATQILTIAGKKIGFIGITSDIVPTMYKQLARGFNFLQGESNYVNLINSLATDLRSSGAVMVVVMSELGIHKDYQLAQNVNIGSVDVFFSAHTHEFTNVPLQSASGAIVVEAGNDGYLGKLEVSLDNADSISLINWELIPITPSLAENGSIKALVDTERAPFLVANPNLSDPMGTSSQELHRPITDTVGYSKITLTRLNSLESNFNDAFTDILRQYSGMQASISPGFRFDAPTGAPGTLMEGNVIATGEITAEDIYRFFPVFYTLANAEIRVDSLTWIVEKLLKNVYSSDAFEQGGGWVDGFSGLKFDIDLDQPDYARVSAAYLANNIVLSGSDTITITGCQRPLEGDTILCSHSGFFNKSDFINPSSSLAWTPQQILEDYLMTDSIPDPNRSTFNDISGNATYPAYPWVQPLPASAACLTLDLHPETSTLPGLRLFPNPARDQLFISWENEAWSRPSLQIYSAQGALVLKLETLDNGQAIVVSQLAKGAYFLMIQDQQGQVARILVRQ